MFIKKTLITLFCYFCAPLYTIFINMFPGSAGSFSQSVHRVISLWNLDSMCLETIYMSETVGRIHL